MNKENLLKAIRDTNSKLFTIVFVKVSGETRTLYGKTGVKRFMSKNPNKRKYSTTNKDVVRVFDVEKKEYRAFKLDSVVEFRCGHTILM